MGPIIPVEQALIERARWLIRLRWIAALGAAVALLVSRIVFHIPVPILPLTICVLWITAYNSYLSHTQRSGVLRATPPEALYRSISLSFNAQIALDWITLVVMLHFSGGLENPFILYFIFHAILAGMLLSRRASYVHATLAIALVGLMGIGEHTGWLPHVEIDSAVGASLQERSLTSVAGVLFAFATTMYLAVYLTTGISSILRRREMEVAELDESLRLANSALLEKDRIRSEYVLRVSHDLASPLAATHSMLSLVIQSMSAGMSDKAKDFLNRSLKRVDGLLRLARGLYDLSRIRASRTLAIEPCGMASVVQSSVQEMLLEAGTKRIDVNLDIQQNLPFLFGDKDHIETAVQRLLTNAAQYSLPGVRISVCAREINGWIEVTVEDTGIGIPASEVPFIYDEFYRGSMAKELEPNGWGLGLTLVKHIVDRHGGTISVESTPGKGSRFTLLLPSFRNGSVPIDRRGFLRDPELSHSTRPDLGELP